MTAGDLFPREPSQEAQPEDQARLVIVDALNERHDLPLAGLDLFLQKSDTRIHIHNLSCEVADLILYAGSMRHTL